MQKKKYKAGLIGYGYWGSVLLRNFHNSAHFEVLKVCDHNLEKLKKVADISPRIKTCTDHNEILEDKSIDIVIIATQAGTHYDLVREALINDKNVFVEKPLTLNSDEALDLVKLNRKKKLTIMTDHTYLFTQQYKEVKRIVEKGILGRILHFHSTRADFGLFQKDANILWHLFYHDLYILLDIFEKYRIKSIKASGFSHIIDKIEDTAYVSIQYEQGLSAEVLVNMIFPAKERKIIITGNKKILHWDDTARDKLKIYHKCARFSDKDKIVKYELENNFKIVPISQVEALKTEIDYFYYCLKEKIAPLNNENSAYRVIKLLEAIEVVMRKDGVGLKIWKT